MPSRTMGPVLGFRGVKEDAWSVCAIYASDKPADLSWSCGTLGEKLKGRVLKSLNGVDVSLYEWSIPMTAKVQTVKYKVGNGDEWQFKVPAQGPLPRIAYASCNGFSDPKLAKNTAHPEERWESLVKQHRKNPFHLLLMGGDQLYADGMWREIPALRDWLDLPLAKRVKVPATPALKKELESFYFELYLKNWSYPMMAQAFAQIPSVMMWDDHDIFDGWGSYPENGPGAGCHYYKAIFEQANAAFRVFQLKIGSGEKPAAHAGGDDYSAFHDLGQLGIAVPDLRSARTPDQVMSRASADAFFKALDNWKPSPEKPSHLLVLSSIPVVYPSFRAIETVLGWLPGRQEIEDDLKDHWSSPPHQGERQRLIMRLLTLAEEKRVRVTILSGDVHVAALGVIESSRSIQGDNSQVINQLISSGIVHPGPPGVVQFFLKHVLDREEEVAPRVTARTLSFPGTNERFLGGRNWLCLNPDEPGNDAGRFWVEWHVEGWPTPFTHVIHPCKPV